MSVASDLADYAGIRIWPDQLKRMNSLIKRYGKVAVKTDFQAWFDSGQSFGLAYPLGTYLDTAPGRLQSFSPRAKQAINRIDEVIASVVQSGGRAPSAASVQNLLISHAPEDIQAAFASYVAHLDDYQRDFATKTFFQDGAGGGIILSYKREKEAREKTETDARHAIEAGKAAGAAKREEIFARIKQNEEAAAKLKDNPFGE